MNQQRFYFYIASLLLMMAYIAPVNLSLSSLNSPLWPHFYNDCLAFLSLLVALLAILVSAKPLQFPRYIVFLFLLSLVPIFQYYFGLIFFLGDALLSTIYIFAFVLTIVLGFNLKLIFDGEIVLTELAKAFLVIGLVSFYISLYQFFSLQYAGSFIYESSSFSRVVGNTRQPNHFSSILILSLISAVYLYEKKVISLTILLTLIACFISSIVLSQSRTSLVVFIFLSILLFCFNFKYKFRVHFSIFIYIAFCYFSFDIVIDWLRGVIYFDQIVSEKKDVYNFSDKWRYIIWCESIKAVIEGSLWGYGWNQSILAPVLVEGGFDKGVRFSEAHNLFLDLFIWVGPIIGLLFLIIILFFVYQAFFGGISAEQWFLLSLLGVLFIHAMFEYPLHYAYFLLPFGLLVGILDFKNSWFSSASRISLPPVLTTSVIFFGSLLFSVVLKEYRIIDPGDYIVRKDFDNLSRVILMTQLKNYVLLSNKHIKKNMPKKDLLWLKQVAYRYPTPKTLGLYGRALVLNGFPNEADNVFKVAIRLMPDKTINDIYTVIYQK